MSVASSRVIAITFTGDVTASLAYAAAANASSPGEIQIVALASGPNTITPPAGSKSCTILPPSGNTVLLTLKGVTGDTGVPLHKTDPTSFGIDSVATFCLTAASTVTVRLIWT